jgi:hypothetical protein
MLCLWLFCNSITKMSDSFITDLSRYVWLFYNSITKMGDSFITVIYHAMSLTIL